MVVSVNLVLMTGQRSLYRLPDSSARVNMIVWVTPAANSLSSELLLLLHDVPARSAR